jgi:hypothetical protein
MGVDAITNRTTDFRCFMLREYRSGPQAGSFNEIGLSRQQSIRNCGFFGV